MFIVTVTRYGDIFQYVSSLNLSKRDIYVMISVWSTEQTQPAVLNPTTRAHCCIFCASETGFCCDGIFIHHKEAAAVPQTHKGQAAQTAAEEKLSSVIS